jgi:SAM-dependent methyltransferase
MSGQAVEQQRSYYADTARQYDQMHFGEGGHDIGLELLAAVVHRFDVRTVLDVGAGTGRVLDFLRRRCPDVSAVGVEPVAELRAVGHGKGIAPDRLIEGTGERLPAAAGEFDVVCEFGMLHHVPRPTEVVREMLRVARRAVLFSDCNCYGQGSATVRLVKRLLRVTSLWSAAVWIKTGGKGYHVSAGDGVFYPYSVFDNYRQIAAACETVHVMNTGPAGTNPVVSAGHVVLLGVKKSVRV